MSKLGVFTYVLLGLSVFEAVVVWCLSVEPLHRLGALAGLEAGTPVGLAAGPGLGDDDGEEDGGGEDELHLGSRPVYGRDREIDDLKGLSGADKLTDWNFEFSSSFSHR